MYFGEAKSTRRLVYDDVASERAFRGIALDFLRCDGNTQLVVYLEQT